MTSHGPFDRADFVGRYEAWYSTPFGRVADRIQQSLILELLRPVAPGASVLEIGCGTAHFAAALGERGYRVVGADPSFAMLATARARVPVVRAEGSRLPFAEDAFDAAVLIAVLEFAPDPVALLREALRVARLRVVVLTLSSRSWLGLRRRIAGRLGHPVFAAAAFRSRARTLALARAAGAAPERVRTALLLPPSLAGRWPSLEERLSRRALPGAGILGLALTAPAASEASRPASAPRR